MYTDIEKITQIIAYLTSKEQGDMNYMKVIKLLFFADKLFVRRYGQMISESRYVAMENGPVASVALNVIKMPECYNEEYIKKFIKIEGYRIKIKRKPDMEYLSDRAVETMDEIYSFFGKFNEWELRDLTHKYNEWGKYESRVSNGGVCDMNILDFFKGSINQDSIFEAPEEDLELSKEIYTQHITCAS